MPDQRARGDNGVQATANGAGSFLDTPLNAAAIEYKKGYVMRKCCYDSNNKKSELPFYDRNDATAMCIHCEWANDTRQTIQPICVLSTCNPAFVCLLSITQNLYIISCVLLRLIGPWHL